MPWKSWQMGRWSLKRLPSSIDLVATDAICHGKCESNFFTKKYISTTKRAVMEHMPGGCTTNAMKSNWLFSNSNWKLCKWLDKQAESFTIYDFAEKDLNVCSSKGMKKQLEKHHQNSIFFTNEPGRSDIVCFTVMARNHIIRAKIWKTTLTMKKWESL